MLGRRFRQHSDNRADQCAVVLLFADPDTAHDRLSFGGGYLARPNVGVLGSHGASAVPLVATPLSWGRRGLSERIERCMGLDQRLAHLMEEHDELELFQPPETGMILGAGFEDVGTSSPPAPTPTGCAPPRPATRQARPDIPRPTEVHAMALISQPGSDYQLAEITPGAGNARDIICLLLDIHAVPGHLWLDGTQPEITTPAEGLPARIWQPLHPARPHRRRRDHPADPGKAKRRLRHQPARPQSPPPRF